ncbi:PPOX class F420-dependent oxidoreductase [Rhodococcus artemisiae]|uniref:PPOX class F420-dependent oxidoreductase n=1 Tax=Rhodococcus artemisiae TaxID=714159 RepID=A0ABU7LGW7_9NOCA|nr:PPOX class F420-dependent oxidoreductase [Rhodococcus artemisiae]MEE2060799.1 PPOX class F420-dependent oxidoreductase [Rhodococcus artemisiae]
MPADESALEALFGDTGVAALVTLKRSGRPQLSNILYHYDHRTHTFSISITDTRAKTRNMRRDSRVSLFKDSDDGWSYAVAEGNAELSDVARNPDDDATEHLVALYRKVQGEHPDWDEFRAAMVAEQRLVLRVRVDRFYGAASQ